MACGLDTVHIGDSNDIGRLSSQRCLECHGSDKQPDVCKLGNTVLDAALTNNDRDSLKQSTGDRVMLLEGKVSCVSCHDPYSTQRARLFMSNRGSAMCLACHNKLEQVDHTAYAKEESACLGCHPRVGPSHKRARVDPSNVALPLDARGDMLCMTCHDCINGTCLLRLNKPELCASCHDCTQGMACVLGAAHLGKSEKNLTNNACLGCHDNTLAQTCGLSGMRDDAGLNIQCTSCHNPYSAQHSKLVKGLNMVKAIQQNACPRTIAQDMPDCLECHTER
jgi:predicted CXXCH cytochrome family protein